jgi:hypothetical protein
VSPESAGATQGRGDRNVVTRETRISSDPTGAPIQRRAVGYQARNRRLIQTSTSRGMSSNETENRRKPRHGSVSDSVFRVCHRFLRSWSQRKNAFGASVSAISYLSLHARVNGA